MVSALRVFVRRVIARGRAHEWNSSTLLVHARAEKVLDGDRWYWRDEAWFTREVRAERDLRAGRFVDFSGAEDVLGALGPDPGEADPLARALRLPRDAAAEERG